MKTEKLNYDLPAELIAQQPAPMRGDSRLLILRRSDGALIDSHFSEIVDYFNPGDCLVLNDTKVLPAKFFAKRPSGAALEGLFLDEPQKGQWLVMLKNARRVKPDQQIYLSHRHGDQHYPAHVRKHLGQGRWLLEPDTDESAEKILEKIGFAPLPPYIKRNKLEIADLPDRQRYQTIFARHPGAVAAPTAGLHFTPQLLEQIQQKNVSIAHLTLHVGAGTFKPVEAQELEDHQMHSERFSLDETNAALINAAIKEKKRVIAVGTTSVRTLETLAAGKTLTAAAGATKLFITPGYEFKVIEAMVTNFHLPKSTLLALVAAFAGLEEALAAYSHAVQKKYRFYSYGDAMLII